MFLRNLAVSFVDFLYPPLCLTCSELLSDRHGFVCPDCLGDIRRIDRSDHAFRAIRERVCGDGSIDELYAPFWFEQHSPLQSIIHALKYQHIPQVGMFLGEQLGRVLPRPEMDMALVIPVPLHKAKFREREYNQAEFIARGVVSMCPARLEAGLVRRVMNTSTQTELTALERRRNVAGAFSLRREDAGPPPEGPALIVDDVLTTGATIRSIALALRDRGFRTIIAGTAAVTS